MNTMKRRIRFEEISFEVNVEGKPIEVMAKPYLAANEQKRFRVSYNGSPIHIFGLDEKVNKLRLLDSAAQQIPPQIEHAIASTLLHKMAA
jgi:hypothetical protein